MKNEINRALVAKKKIFSLFAALTLSVGLWADGSVITYKATEKLETQFAGLGSVVSHEWNESTGEGTVTYSGTITSIGEKAFFECVSLQSIDLSKITTIGLQAFAYCSQLQSIGQLESVTTIRNSAFENCSALSSVINMPNVTTIEEVAFAFCSNLTSVSMPKVTTIERETFVNCGKLTSVDISNVTTIGENAFYSCSLSSVDISKVTTIGEQAFAWCSLSSITLPATLTTIGSEAFRGAALQSVTFLRNSCNIGSDAFGGVGATTPAALILPDGWTGSKPIDRYTSWFGGYFVTNLVYTPYIDVDGELRYVYANPIYNGSINTWYEENWYVVNSTVDFPQGVVCQGAVKLILADGAQLTATGTSYEMTGHGTPAIKVSNDASLTIYGQSTGDQMGQLIATGGLNAAGIGGNSQLFDVGSNITINGGKVTAYGGSNACGIGGGEAGCGYNITINGGIVTATGGSGYAGIGGDAGASGIYISDAYVLKNGETVFTHSSGTDMAGKLGQYVQFGGLATPYTRTMSVDQWGTVCLPYATTEFDGAAFYKINYYDSSIEKLYVEEVSTLEAGVPYIFQAAQETVTIFHEATAPFVSAKLGSERGLHGSFARTVIESEGNMAAISNNMVVIANDGGTVTVPACRAYINMDEVPTTYQPTSAPLRCIGVPGKNPMGLGQWNKRPEGYKGQKTMKVIENGQFRIIRDGKTYNAQGIEL